MSYGQEFWRAKRTRILEMELHRGHDITMYINIYIYIYTSIYIYLFIYIYIYAEPNVHPGYGLALHNIDC